MRDFYLKKLKNNFSLTELYMISSFYNMVSPKEQNKNILFSYSSLFTREIFEKRCNRFGIEFKSFEKRLIDNMVLVSITRKSDIIYYLNLDIFEDSEYDIIFDNMECSDILECIDNMDEESSVVAKQDLILGKLFNSVQCFIVKQFFYNSISFIENGVITGRLLIQRNGNPHKKETLSKFLDIPTELFSFFETRLINSNILVKLSETNNIEDSVYVCNGSLFEDYEQSNIFKDLT